MQQKAIILTSQQVEGERHHKVNLRPQKCPHNTQRVGPKTVNQHQEHDADDDSGVCYEKTDERQIRKTVAEIWSNDRLQCSANSPEISQLEPPSISRPQGDANNHHCPVT